MVAVEMSDPTKKTASCIAATLEDAWKEDDFGVSIEVRLIDETGWPQDPATGWSEIDRYQLSCDAGEIEGCYQLGLVYEKDPEQRRENLQKSADHIKTSCAAGHAEACAHGTTR